MLYADESASRVIGGPTSVLWLAADTSTWVDSVRQKSDNTQVYFGAVGCEIWQPLPLPTGVERGLGEDASFLGSIS